MLLRIILYSTQEISQTTRLYVLQLFAFSSLTTVISNFEPDRTSIQFNGLILFQFLHVRTRACLHYLYMSFNYPHYDQVIIYAFSSTQWGRKARCQTDQSSRIWSFLSVHLLIIPKIIGAARTTVSGTIGV